jgi:hypothetical protein
MAVQASELTARSALWTMAGGVHGADARELLRRVALDLVAPRPDLLHALPTAERTELGQLCAAAMRALEAGLLPQLQGRERELLGRLLVETFAAALCGELVELADVALSQQAAAVGQVH